MKPLRPSIPFLFATVAIGALSCAHGEPPKQVRYAELGHGALATFDGKTPLIVEFQAGDRVPVNLELTGEEFALAPEHPPVELVAKQHCFVWFGADGVRAAPDLAHLDEKPRQPGSFRVGFNTGPNQGTKLDVVIVGPKR